MAYFPLRVLVIPQTRGKKEAYYLKTRSQGRRENVQRPRCVQMYSRCYRPLSCKICDSSSSSQVNDLKESAKGFSLV